FCLLTGDLADAGGEAAYASLAEALRRLPMPAHLLPGNHDSRAALRRHFPQLANNDGGFMQAALATPGGYFLLLDTVEPGAPWGSYCIQRREWLAQQLAAAGDRPLYVAMHHPPLALGIPSMDQFALRDAEAFWSVIAPHRTRIRHLFFGHLHRPIGGSWRGIPFSCTSSPNHQVALDLTTVRGDDVPGCREPAGFAVILIDTDSVVVHHQQLFGGETAFWL
ncbi:MAG: phosphodiesterase, partial [Azonexus sp.]